MTLSFREFIPKYLDGTIQEDAAWRAYDIEQIAGVRHSLDALKTLGYRELNTFGFDKCAQDYNLRHIAQAKQLLGLWWAWTRIALGEVKRNIPLREGAGNGD